MFRDPSPRAGLRRCALVAGLVTALGGAAAAPAAAAQQWIAMTPLSSATPDPAAPWFPRAAALVLRDELAAIPGLMVIVPPPAATGVADMPQVEWIAGGALGVEDGRMHFDITLRRAGEASPSWQQRFEYAWDDDAAQWRRDIVEALAAQVGVQANAAAPADLGACRSVPASADTLRAIEAYGNYRDRQDLLRVRGWLEQALRQEPDCTEAQAHHAMTHVSELTNRWSPDPKAQLALADELSRRAVAANPRQPYARMARVEVLRMQGQLDAAVQEATTLTQLDPSNGLFVGRLAALQLDAGNAAATLAAARKMQSLPNGTLAALQQGMLFEALALYSMGEEGQAAAGLRKLVAVNPQNGLAWRMLAGIEALQGRDVEASMALQQFIALAPPGQTIKRLRTNETAVADLQFQRQRERFYEGLRRAGLPE